MSKKVIKVWVNRINKDLELMGHKPITVSQFRKASTGHAVLDKIVAAIAAGGVEYATA